MEKCVLLKKQSRKRERERESRDARYELLRIVCMLLIIASHAFMYSEAVDMLRPGSVNYCLVYYLKHLFRVSVTAFVLVNGYFMCGRTLHLKKITLLWAQTFTYSLGIYLVLCVVGAYSLEPAKLLKAVLPIISRKYWFVSCYVFLLMWTPVLNRAVAALDRRQHLLLLIVLLGVYCVLAPAFYWMGIDGTLISGDVTGVKNGLSTVFFIVVYILAAYLRKYRPEPRFRRWWQNLLLYGGLCLLATAGTLLLYRLRGRLPDAIVDSEMFYAKNSLPLVLAAVCFFRLFQCLPAIKNGLAAAICRVSPLVFGVYLIHDSNLIRHLLWKNWTHLKDYADGAMLWPHLIAAVLGVFCVCCIIEFVRRSAGQLLGINRAIGKASDRAEERINAGLDRLLEEKP